MGCGGSAGLGGKAQLEKIENELDALGEEADFEKLQGFASDLKGIFTDVVSAGGKDIASLRRIEVLSEKILTRLKKQIGTADKDKIMQIARTLDSVRATKATTAIEDAYELRKRDSVEQDEVKAKQPYDKLKVSFAKLNSPTAVVPNLGAVLDDIEEVHATAPESKKVTESLMKVVTPLTEKVLKSHPHSWGKVAVEAKQVSELSARLDGIATKLVTVLSSTWDPPLYPEVAHRTETDAARHCSNLLNAAQKAADERNQKGAYAYLEQVQAWFDLLPEGHSMLDRVVGVFGSVDFEVLHQFKECIKKDDQAGASAHRDFAKQLDALRPKFKGLSPAAAMNLDEVLNEGEIKGRVEKHLDTISAELAKADPERTKEAPDTSALTVALQAISADWDQVVEKESGDASGLVSRLADSCKSIEEWAGRTVAESANPSQWNGLLGFAGEYDKSRRKLIPPEPAGGPLQPRIGRQVAINHLKVAEEDLQHPKIPEPKRLLDSLRGAIEATPTEGGIDDLTERLSAALRDTEDRVLKGYLEALASGQRRRCNAIKDFAEQFDEVGALSGLVWSLEGATLSVRLQAENDRLTERLVSEVESGEDFEKVLKALQQLEASKPPTDSPLIREKLPAALESLGQRLKKAGSDHLGGSDEDVKAVDALVVAASKMDAAWSSMRREEATIESESDVEEGTGASGAPAAKITKLRDLLLEMAVEVHIARAEKLVAASPLQLPVLKLDLEIACKTCKEKCCPKSSRQRLLQLADPLEKALLGALAEAGTSADQVIDLAVVADSALVSLGKEDSQMKARLDSVQAVSPILEQLREEVAKEGGAEDRFDPRKVVAGLRNLEPQWEAVSAIVAFEDSLSEVLMRFGEKIKESAAKNAGSTEAIKVLSTLGQEADEAHMALEKYSPGLRGLAGFEAIVARAGVYQKLEAVQAELDKATNMNPTLLLKGLEELRVSWAKMGGESAMDPAFDEVNDLRNKVEAIRESVHERMAKSMEEAQKAKNAGKATALIKFAGQFDAAMAKLEPADQAGSLGGLKEKIEAITE